MVRIAVCDDEQYMLNKISAMVSAFFGKSGLQERLPRSVEVTPFSCGETLLQSDRAFDVVILDIQMAGMDGMETARQLRSRGFRGYLIFVTVLGEMVFRSFEVQAYDYLVKPVGKEQFERTMERLLASLMQREAGKKLLVQRGYDSSIIAFDEIVYCEITGRKIYLHLVSSEVIGYYDKIENLETKLDRRFYRCHRSYLINMEYLRGYSNGAAKLEGGAEIPVSRLRSKDFSEVILRYMERGKG